MMVTTGNLNSWFLGIFLYQSKAIEFGVAKKGKKETLQSAIGNCSNLNIQSQIKKGYNQHGEIVLILYQA